ncbi:unnamed protein product [Rhodiola kirilowii]
MEHTLGRASWWFYYRIREESQMMLVEWREIGRRSRWVFIEEGGGSPVGLFKSGGVSSGFQANREGEVANISQSFKRRSVKLEAFQECEEWVPKALVVELKILILGETLEKEMRAEGISLVKVIPLGGRKMIVQFACEEDLEKCLTKDYSYAKQNFSKVQRWSEEELSTSRSVWISIFGLPFRAWTEQNCEHLAAPFGVFLKMDDRDVRFVGVGRARMLIKTRKMERISEVLEADISGKVYEISLCEECWLGGCGIDNPESFGVDSGEDRGQEVQGIMESNQSVPESPRGKEVDGEYSLSGSSKKEEDSGNSVPSRDGSECSWDATLNFFLQRQGKGSAGKRSDALLGSSLLLSSPRAEGQGNDHASAEREDAVCFLQPEVAVDAGGGSETQSGGERLDRTFVAKDMEEDGLSQDENFVLDEVFSSRHGSLESASKRRFRQKSGTIRDFTVKRILTGGKSKESKEKEVFKVQKRKIRAELDRLKRSYLEVLENSNKSSQMPGADSQLVVERIDPEEEERKLYQRKEAEETTECAKSLGIIASAPDEEVVKFFIKLDEERRKSREYDESCIGKQ